MAQPGAVKVVALGASNLTRGIHALVSTARTAWGPQVEVVAALGHGRSYGTDSRVLGRSLQGILQCGIWRQIGRPPGGEVRALVTDVGNDILYGFDAGQIVAWVEEATRRLSQVTENVVITDLPLDNMRTLSEPQFMFWRSVLFPYCRLSFREVFERAEQVSAGLQTVARSGGFRFCRLQRDWYGIDPIHVRRRMRRAAWQVFLGTSTITPSRQAWLERVLLSVLPPERRWLFGMEQVTPQRGTALPGGGRVWLF
jgi:hypothetical protein